MPDRLTVEEFLALFGRTGDVGRWVVYADSDEYLTLVTYHVERSDRR